MPRLRRRRFFRRSQPRFFGRKTAFTPPPISEPAPADYETGDPDDNIPLHVEEPDECVIDNIMEFSQYPDYPTGCESVALYILLSHYGAQATVGDIIEELPKGPVPYRIGNIDYGANPEKEFVGSPYDKHSYGVYEKPLAETAEKFREGAKSEKGADIERIKELVRGGSPVVAWCAMSDDRVIEFKSGWKDYETGEDVVWGSGEHAVVVYGFRDGVLLISDPNSGAKRETDAETFAQSFDALGGRILYYEE